jgi:hypothetical protein
MVHSRYFRLDGRYDAMTVIIEGTIIKGFGVANKNIRFQMPHLVWQFPGIKDIYPGSINVSLEKPLRILTYDYTSICRTFHSSKPAAAPLFSKYQTV